MNRKPFGFTLSIPFGNWLQRIIGYIPNPIVIHVSYVSKELEDYGTFRERMVINIRTLDLVPTKDLRVVDPDE